VLGAGVAQSELRRVQDELHAAERSATEARDEAAALRQQCAILQCDIEELRAEAANAPTERDINKVAADVAWCCGCCAVGCPR
jgi:phage shock protein A